MPLLSVIDPDNEVSWVIFHRLLQEIDRIQSSRFSWCTISRDS